MWFLSLTLTAITTRQSPA